ncbi:EmrB/QacA subfamily drug resistance transporter [Thermosporothrix hazakensis]|jgi:EmrB/QacA subfamily drug resistance transporter|uniref:EmrB/QacA subfamily drug resistance transporter n=1 Tax=Thermosporothrix hazakensis TaxID=644383 RepID=A0A326UDF5_THEHA|nr:MDR family MFS transporter [Thermosporothrix hazakensis]PZW24015.1 EmrB/QacA subfamily drug resistance transporter [Thermosporothrix hazakensis]GCE50230.1 MFS transporter [Thermosporothrix hazakensis]
MSKNTKGLVLFALMLVMSLATLESTVIATAMPSIVAQLGGITLYSWAFSAYLLTSTTTVPLYGKFADLYGRKIILFIGSGIFLLGSLACALSQSMEQLIVFRAIQGIGAGAIMPLVLTIVADLSSNPEELAKMQGVMGALWGVSSVAGPMLGGLLVDYASWHWVFYLNIPLGIFALILLFIFYKEQFVRQKHQLDYAGTILLTGTILVLLFALIQGGSAWAWTSLPSLSLFLVALIGGVAFWLVERKAAEPILPFSLFRIRPIALATAGGFLLGAILYGLTTYIPLFVQGVQGDSATGAGVVLIPYSLSWSILSMSAAFVLKRLGFRIMAQAGTFITLLAAVMILFLQKQTSLIYLLVAMAVIGVGFGLANIVYTIIVQHSAPKHLVGVASASTQFVRLLGGTVGVAAMGSVLNGQIGQRFTEIAAHVPALAEQMQKGNSPVTVLLTPELNAAFSSDVLDQLRSTFAQSLFWVFLLMTVLALVSFLLTFGYRRKELESSSAESEEVAAQEQKGFVPSH